MNTRLLMVLSAAFMGITGIALSFLPQEIIIYLNSGKESVIEVLVLQILGSLYIAFAMVNWIAKANLIGGIYSRPISVGNFTHFVIGAITLINGYSFSQNIGFQAITLLYLGFAICFGWVLFRHPIGEKK